MQDHSLQCDPRDRPRDRESWHGRIPGPQIDDFSSEFEHLDSRHTSGNRVKRARYKLRLFQSNFSNCRRCVELKHRTHERKRSKTPEALAQTLEHTLKLLPTLSRGSGHRDLLQLARYVRGLPLHCVAAAEHAHVGRRPRLLGIHAESLKNNDFS